MPHELALDHLARIAARSAADLATLRARLAAAGEANEVWRTYGPLIAVADRWFIGHWPYVDRIVRHGGALRFDFYPGRNDWAIFEARLVWRDAAGATVLDEVIPGIGVRRPWYQPIPALLSDRPFGVSRWLDDAPAFSGGFTLDNAALIRRVR